MQTLRAGRVSIIASAEADSEQSDAIDLTIEDPLVEFEGNILYLADGDLYLMTGSNREPRRLTHDQGDIYKGFPRLNWDSSQVTYYSADKYIMTMDTSGSDTPSQLEMPKDRTAPFPYFRQDGSILFTGQGDPGYGSSIRFWNYGPDGTLDVYSTAIFGGRVSYFGGVTPDGVLVYEDGGSVNFCPYDDVDQTVYVGSGSNPKIAQNDHPSLIVYDFKENIRVSDFERNRRNLTETAYAEYFPSLSPDESQVVFVSERDGNRDLFLMNVDGTGLVNLTNTPDIAEVLPDWGN